MKNRHACWVAIAAGAALAAVTTGALAEEAGVRETYRSYSTYGVTQEAQIAMTIDGSAFDLQGWSVGQDEYVFPVMVGLENAVTVTTVNGEFLSMAGSPRVIGTIELVGTEGQQIRISNFALPLVGRADVPFMGADHPVLQVPGESLTVDINGSNLVIRGSIGLHAAAAEVGLDAAVGEIGEFTLTSPIDITDVDNTVRPVSTHPGSGPEELPGADVTVGSLPNLTHWTSAGAIGGLRAYSVATTSCNVGTQPLDWFVAPNPRHPVIGQNMYRYMNGRFEQLGQSWLKHGFCALQQSLCQGCSPVCGGCCSQLGVGCSDPYSSSRNGEFGNMGPKREINAHMGTNLGNHTFPSGNVTLRGRLQVRESDLDPDLNPGAVYYVEGQYVAQDDAQFGAMTNDNNNASYRQVVVSTPSFFISPSGDTIRQKAAIHAWKVQDPQVEIVDVDVPGEGRFTLGYRVTDNGDGTWHYEYALHNLNSDRSAQSFSVPLAPGVTVTNVGFHDVDYHSGDPYSLTDWPGIEGGDALVWSSESFDQNPNANALRWGTMYNYRFDANTAPEAGVVTVGLFKPGTPASVTAHALVPEAAGPVIVHGAPGVSFADHAFSGYIDPRGESSDGVNVDLGINTVTLVFSEPVFAPGGGAVSAGNFTVTETSGGSAPTVTAVNAGNNPTITVTLSRNITLQEWTTIRANVQNAAGVPIANLGDQGPGVEEPDRVDIGFLPTDANQDGSVTPFDLLQYRQIVNDVIVPTPGTDADYADTDRDGSVAPLDLLMFRQLINGVSPPATQHWNGASMNAAQP